VPNVSQLALGREITSEAAACFDAQIYTFLSGGHQNPGLGLGAVELNPCGIALKTHLCKPVLSFCFIGFSFTIIQLFAANIFCFLY
jgi:hypothetical protein